MKWRWVIPEACPLGLQAHWAGAGEEQAEGQSCCPGWLSWEVEGQEGQAHSASRDGGTSELLPRRLCSSLHPHPYSTHPTPTVRCSLGAHTPEDPRCDAGQQPSSMTTARCLGVCRVSPSSAASLAPLRCRQAWAGGCGPHPVVPRELPSRGVLWLPASCSKAPQACPHPPTMPSPTGSAASPVKSHDASGRLPSRNVSPLTWGRSQLALQQGWHLQGCGPPKLT